MQLTPDEILADLGKTYLELGDEKTVAWHPRAVDVPTYRDELLKAWQPDGAWTRVAPVIAEVSGGSQDLIPAWEADTIAEAAMWFVGADMCDLLVSAAPDLPDMPLDRRLVPDLAGLVIFERLLVGIDAEGLDMGQVHVAGYLWGPAVWSWNGDLCIGITVYGSIPGRNLLSPLGGLIWPFGRSADDPLTDEAYAQRGERYPRQFGAQRLASIAEDRRRLMALWLLSSQSSVAAAIRSMPGGRAAARRARRTGRDRPAHRSRGRGRAAGRWRAARCSGAGRCGRDGHRPQEVYVLALSVSLMERLSSQMASEEAQELAAAVIEWKEGEGAVARLDQTLAAVRDRLPVLRSLQTALVELAAQLERERRRQ